MITARVEPIERDLVLLLGDDLTPEGRSHSLAQFAREALADAEAQNRQALGRVPEHETIVDGRRGAILETVRPDGTIVFEFELLEEVFEWIEAMLILHSPVKTGQYARSHLFFADNEQADPSRAPPAREYAFVNTQPYARKIERGQSSQAPDGVFEAVSILASRRFGNLSRIRFGYRSLPAGAIGAWAGKTARVGRGRTAAKRQDWLTRQPAIVLTV